MEADKTTGCQGSPRGSAALGDGNIQSRLSGGWALNFVTGAAFARKSSAW